MKRKESWYKEYIIQNPRIMVGKPVIKGTRNPVEKVISHLAGNPDLNDLFVAHPELTVEDVKACLVYAHAVLEHQDARSDHSSAHL